MIKVPSTNSEYLSLGGPTLDKLMEMSNVATFINDYDAKEIQIQIHGADGEEESKEFTLDYFKPNYSPINGTSKDYANIEYIDNLFFTIELNPPEQVFVKRPDGIFIHLIEGEEVNETLETCYDVSDKLRDCIDKLRSGEKLDSMQDAFLRHHNIIE